MEFQHLQNVTISTGSSLGIGTGNPISGLDAREQTGLFATIGLGTDTANSGQVLSAYGTVSVDGSVGIGTTYVDPSGAGLQIYSPLIDVNDGHLNFKSNSTVGFNTVDPKAVFDFSNVGSATTRPVMVVPNINNSTRNGIGETPTGSLIFNLDTLKFQGYTGVAWTDFN